MCTQQGQNIIHTAKQSSADKATHLKDDINCISGCKLNLYRVEERVTEIILLLSDTAELAERSDGLPAADLEC